MPTTKATAKKQSVSAPKKKKSNKNAPAPKAMSTFFNFDPATTTFSGAPKKRPTNQNSWKVVTKTSENIDQKIPKGKLRDTTRIFQKDVSKGTALSDMNSGAGFQMAHVRSADELKQTLAAVLTTASSTKLTAAKRQALADRVDSVADGYISSDAEDSDRKRVRTMGRVLTSQHVTPRKRAHAAAFLLRRWNRSSRMLVGADPSTNMSIGSRQDQPTTRDGKVFPHALKRSKLLDSLQDHLGMAHEKFLKHKGKPVSSTMDYT
jgi:hypothetical protein